LNGLERRTAASRARRRIPRRDPRDLETGVPVRISRVTRLAVWTAALVVVPAVATAQTAPAAQQPEPAAQQPEPERSDPDVLIDALQPDFSLAALPTTLRMPKNKWAFRVTHRFQRPLGQGDFLDLLGDAFGVDGAAQIGLELRYGLISGTQIGVHRTSERTIQIFGQHSILTQRDSRPIALDAYATIEGEDNLRDHVQSTLGAIVSRKVGRYAALYAEPLIVLNSNGSDVGDNDTVLIGLGGRVRLMRALYVVGEITPRLAGYDPDRSQVSFAIEGRAGGHLFQINVSNGIGTTFGQIARGAVNYDNWFLGFNISRKFF
jgi:uncharacterized beta barrel domain-containing protein DUF5777